MFGTSNLIKLILHKRRRTLVVCCLDVIDNKNKEKFIPSITRVVSPVDEQHNTRVSGGNESLSFRAGFQGLLRVLLDFLKIL